MVGDMEMIEKIEYLDFSKASLQEAGAKINEVIDRINHIEEFFDNKMELEVNGEKLGRSPKDLQPSLTPFNKDNLYTVPDADKAFYVEVPPAQRGRVNEPYGSTKAERLAQLEKVLDAYWNYSSIYETATEAVQQTICAKTRASRSALLGFLGETCIKMKNLTAIRKLLKDREWNYPDIYTRWERYFTDSLIYGDEELEATLQDLLHELLEEVERDAKPRT